MSFDELIQSLKALGRNPADIVEWRVGPNTPGRASYSIIRDGEGYAVASRDGERSNDGFYLQSRQLSDGQTSTHFATSAEACDWVWGRVTNPAFIPSGKTLTAAEVADQYQRQMERARQARQD